MAVHNFKTMRFVRFSIGNFVAMAVFITDVGIHDESVSIDGAAAGLADPWKPTGQAPLFRLSEYASNTLLSLP